VVGIGNYTGKKEVPLKIGEKTISKLSISKIPAQEYTGSEIQISNLIVKDGKVQLTENTDYSVTYENNVNIGKASIIITGISPKYVGTKTVSFNIKGISMKNVKVNSATLPKSVNYNGRVHEPELELIYQKDKNSDPVTLVKNTDYTVKYTNNQNVGKAKILITGIGKYTGTIQKTFEIKPFDAKQNEGGMLTVSNISSIVYAKGGAKLIPIVKYNDHILTVGKDYTLSYSNNKAVTTEKTKKDPVVKIKFKGNFKGTVEEYFVINAQDISDLKADIKDKVYSTKKGAWKSTLKIVDLDGKELKAGTDYKKTLLYYADEECSKEVGNTIPEAGSYIWVRADGIGNYANSSVVVKYRITTADISKAKVKVDTQYYTGKAIEPDYKAISSVTVNKQELTAGVDYEILKGSYKNNIKVGTATMQLKGKGNYGGLITVKFTVKKKPFIWRWFE